MNFEKRISSLETEYALVSNFSANTPFDRDTLISKIENQVYQRHTHTRCNSLKFIPKKKNSLHGVLIPQEGSFIDNGSRIYCDIGHLEWANPETVNPKDAVIYEKAAEHILAKAIHDITTELHGANPNPLIYLIKNNIDYSDNTTYGCHENYSLCRYDQNIWDRLEDDLVPFLITRQIFCGSGRIGARIPSPEDQCAFQLSQRADFIEYVTSSHTRSKRGILTKKDDELADNTRWHRLHLISGDSNISAFTNYLKLGITSLVLDLVELNVIHAQQAVHNPVNALKDISRDWKTSRVSLKAGGRTTALDIQKEYLRLASLSTSQLPQNHYKRQLIAIWRQAIEDLENEDPILSTKFDWAIKKDSYTKILRKAGTDWQELGIWCYVIEKTKGTSLPPSKISSSEWLKLQLGSNLFEELDYYVKAQRVNWDAYIMQRRLFFMLCELDIHYHNISRPRDQHEGQLDYLPNMSLLSSEEILYALHHPPQNTRAQQRWNIIRICKNKKINIEAYWDKIHFVDSGNILHLSDPFETTTTSINQLEELIR